MSLQGSTEGEGVLIGVIMMVFNHSDPFRFVLLPPRHYERKLKHLNKQKEGKKRLKAMSLGRVNIPQESFIKLFDSKAK